MSNSYITTKKDFQEFKKWVLYYIDLYQLSSFTVYFSHKNVSKAVASSSIDTEDRGVTFTLSIDSKCDNKKELDIRDTAKHEVVHLLIADLSHLVDGYCTKQQYIKEDEALTCKLTKLLPN